MGQPEAWAESVHRIGDSSLWLPFPTFTLHFPAALVALHPIVLQARETLSFLLDFFFR